MKITAQEEYGLRCALQFACAEASDSLTIPEIAEREGLSTAYVAKLLNLLRQAGLINSARGRSGGYTLGRPRDQISVQEVLGALGSPTWESASCSRYSGTLQMCVRSTSCAVRSLWGTIDTMVNQLLRSITLADLLDSEVQTAIRFRLQREGIVEPLAGILGRIPGVPGAQARCGMAGGAVPGTEIMERPEPSGKGTSS
jgi:Rrf2 family protein